MVLLFLSLGLCGCRHLLDSTERGWWAFVIVAVLWAIIAGILALLGSPL